MKNIILAVFLLINSTMLFGQQTKNSLKFNLNDSGTTYIQAIIMNQTWLRFNQSNPGTLVQNSAKDYTFDIGLRRTRLQLLAQVTDRVFLYFQFGQNNFNSLFNANGGNRKLAAFFHDAVCEYKFSKKNELKIGGGLTIANGLSRFSQPSVTTIMTMDVPVFAQSTVDQTDEFSRKLSVYARGQIWKIDYRLVLSDPFPITSSGAAAIAIAPIANFAQRGHSLQGQGLLIYQFFDHETHTTPYMTGTYLGTKKVLNVAIGGIFQKNAMWKTGNAADTIYQDMKHFAVESYLDMPINKETKSAISAYLGYFNLNYGSNYLRYNGVMNPANGTTLNATNGGITGQGAIYGNAYPMFGSGHTIYTQFGYVLPNTLLKGKGRIMPYLSATLSKFNYMNGLWTNIYNAGINYFINDHKAKVSLDWQNRPTYYSSNNEIKSGTRMNTILLQYQIFF